MHSFTFTDEELDTIAMGLDAFVRINGLKSVPQALSVYNKIQNQINLNNKELKNEQESSNKQ